MLNARTKALFDAVKVGSSQAISRLIEKGVSPDVRDEEGKTALMVASERAYDTIICILIEAGADVNAQGPFGATPLMYAAGYGRYETVKLLLQKGADANAKTTGMYPSTAAFGASANNHDNIVELLNGAEEIP